MGLFGILGFPTLGDSGSKSRHQLTQELWTEYEGAAFRNDSGNWNFIAPVVSFKTRINTVRV